MAQTRKITVVKSNTGNVWELRISAPGFPDQVVMTLDGGDLMTLRNECQRAWTGN